MMHLFQLMLLVIGGALIAKSCPIFFFGLGVLIVSQAATAASFIIRKFKIKFLYHHV